MLVRSTAFGRPEEKLLLVEDDAKIAAAVTRGLATGNVEGQSAFAALAEIDGEGSFRTTDDLPTTVRCTGCCSNRAAL